MNETPRNIWKEPWRGPKSLLWLALLVGVTFLIVCGIGLLWRGKAGAGSVAGAT